ncbi:lytR cell envelope-related transcriptional attenuator family protein [Mycobacterium xenopi 4042]|uniref:LytR cell envelope-related transcriptional attenuator family protein n=1 Tax=Mycobacterium xenopi 4042 TaxID=1299334 RepID=X8CHD5_MYCXE|nr:lytR cell envelope-related transcriptional attenuator family protein [Mycobacterium xenopi 4042]
MRTWSRKSPKAPLSTSTAGPFDDAILGRPSPCCWFCWSRRPWCGRWRSPAHPRSTRSRRAIRPAPDHWRTAAARRASASKRDDERHPAKLAETKIHVLNASGRGGQAADVADALRDLGFAQPSAANDPVYANGRLNCQAQIRFGEAGQASAAAVWLVAPCAELFRDDRADDSVDLALGTDFTTLAHSDDIETVLASLRPGATEESDPALISKIHANSC